MQWEGNYQQKLVLLDIIKNFDKSVQVLGNNHPPGYLELSKNKKEDCNGCERKQETISLFQTKYIFAKRDFSHTVDADICIRL